MQNNLGNIFRIQRFLNDIKYPDSYRIAREIAEYLKKHRRVSEEKIFDRLHKHEPWEYIKGEAKFCKNIFQVTKDTLIPRIETEKIVYDCLKILKKNKIKNIIDIGTGTGCLVISISHILKNTSPYSIYATDISKKALKVARENEKNILKKKPIKWINTNLIENLPILKDSTLLIANLPYIPTKKYTKLNKSVLDYEPKIALDGGENGLSLYEELFKQILDREDNIKVMYIETESTIFKETKDLIKEYFPNSEIKGIKDCFNRNRFLKVSF